jgi:hypothetical protein
MFSELVGVFGSLNRADDEAFASCFYNYIRYKVGTIHFEDVLDLSDELRQ